VLQVWKAKINLRPNMWATYGLLLVKCLDGGDIRTAEVICRLIQQGQSDSSAGGNDGGLLIIPLSN
jgi:hypothetical protein